MIVDVASRDNGRLRAVVGGREIEIGMDTYQASGAVDLASAEKIVHAYAKQNNIPDTDVMVRVRLPKTNVQPRKERKTNDVAANNLTLVKSDNGDALQQMAQNLHDSETNGENAQKASAANPEGATVKRTEGEKKKRPYQKREKEKSARSLAALKRYQEELQKTAAESPTIMEPVAHNATPQEYDAAVMELATAIAKILKANTGVL
jgi:hypothetical protein